MWKESLASIVQTILMLSPYSFPQHKLQQPLLSVAVAWIARLPLTEEVAQAVRIPHRS